MPACTARIRSTQSALQPRSASAASPATECDAAANSATAPGYVQLRSISIATPNPAARPLICLPSARPRETSAQAAEFNSPDGSSWERPRPSDRDQRVDDLLERPARVDLVRARRPKPRLDGLEMVEDERALGGRLAVVVRRPCLDPVEDHLGGRAEQHDRVEPVVEPALVRHAAGDEERPLTVGGEEVGDPVLSPE